MLNRLHSFLEKVTIKNSSVFVLFLCLVLISYGNILFGDFVFDDNIFIENNTQIRSPANIEAIYESSTTEGSGLLDDNFYRPNQQFIYMMLYSFFGLSPFFFHLISILLHALNAFLVFALFKKLGISKKAAFLSGSLFVLHPVLTQAVSYISGLSEPLVALSILGTLIFFIESFDKEKYWKMFSLGILIFSIGLFSKESQAVSIGLMILILLFKWRKGEVKEFLHPFLFIGATAILFSVYLYARINFLNFTGVLGLTGDINSYTESIFVRISTFVHILPEYLKMMVFPWHLYYEKPYVAYESYAYIQSMVSLSVIFLGFFAAGWSFLKGKGYFFLGFFWFISALLPVSGIIPVNSMYLEHWLYIPIIGVILFLASLFDSLSEKGKRTGTVILIVVLVLFSARIFMRNLEWGNPIKFYQNELKYTQTSARIYNNLAMELAEKNDCNSAVPNYIKAIELADVYPQTHHNLARCYIVLGKYDEAGNEYLKALYLQPNFSYSLIGIYNLLKGIEDPRADSFLVLINTLEKGGDINFQDIQSALD